MLKFAGLVLVVLGVALVGCSDDGDHHPGSHDEGMGSGEGHDMDALAGSGGMGMMHDGDADAPPDGMNAICPVSGDDADAGIFAVHNGRKVAFCCDDCIETFKKAPQKYFAR